MTEKKCHFIGIGGIGMSALAQMMLTKKFQVTGSDLKSNYLTDFLKEKGAEIFVGHSKAHIKEDSTVVFSSDISLENPEYLEALNRNCKILHRSDLLLELMQDFKTLAVTGTHGKTTTTSLLATVLVKAGMYPSFMVGGIASDLKTNGAYGKGDYFVAEADESDGTFLKYLPFGAIVTNIDSDHMDHFKTEENLIDSFKIFFKNVGSKEHLFFCGDDPRLLKINPEGISYGFSDHNDLRLTNYKQSGFSSLFDISFRGKIYEQIELGLLGEHNALNAAGVFGLSLMLNVDEFVLREAFKTFKGVSRRLEKKAFVNQILFLDDYAHHPTEIKATLKGLKKATLEKRVIAVYQPHRYSRTKNILGTFPNVFDDVSEVIITDIFAAGEEPIFGVCHEAILKELTSLKISARYIQRKLLASTLHEELLPHDVVISLGAGDITNLAQEIVDFSKNAPLRKMKVGVIFGGRSKEHEISIRSARYVLAQLNDQIYDKVCFGISKQGNWLTGSSLLENDVIDEKRESAISQDVMQLLQQCDILFPILHGSFGEDGTIQGFFEMLDKPYVGCDYRASVICMDKVITKNLMLLNKIATTPFIAITHKEWKSHSNKIIAEILRDLKFPLYIKPSHLGSSVGVSLVEELKDLEKAINSSFRYDTHVLVENEVKGREIEFAVFGNECPQSFPPGEICTDGKFYNYEFKYLSDEVKTKSQAVLNQDILQEGIELAKKAYAIAGCQGMARVDFFLDEKSNYWFNEINTIPGFTSISLYPAICAANGLMGPELMDQLIILGLEKKRRQLTYEF